MAQHTPAPTPARSIYGFFLYLLFKTILCVYIGWAFLPESCLDYLNIHYYPQKYWAVSIPIQCLVAFTLFFFVYPGINLMLTPAIDSINTITDSFSQSNNVIGRKVIEEQNNCKCCCKNVDICVKDAYDLKPLNISENTIPYACDLDVRLVCRKLYLNKNVGNEKRTNLSFKHLR